MPDRWEEARQAAGQRLQTLLEDAGIAGVPLGPSDWWVVVPRGEREKPLQVHVHLGDYTVFFTAFLIRAPRENVEEVYRFLLRRQASRMPARFCLDEDQDILLRAEIPFERLTEDELDWIIGSLLEQHQQTFNSVLRIGFASYLPGARRQNGHS